MTIITTQVTGNWYTHPLLVASVLTPNEICSHEAIGGCVAMHRHAQLSEAEGTAAEFPVGPELCLPHTFLHECHQGLEMDLEK
jgi:hypothetical protein